MLLQPGYKLRFSENIGGDMVSMTFLYLVLASKQKLKSSLQEVKEGQVDVKRIYCSPFQEIALKI